MGLYKFRPEPSSRMGISWTLSTIKEACIIEYGCMGHMYYGNASLIRKGIYQRDGMYSTHLSEIDISLGKTRNLDKVVEKVVEMGIHKCIFLLPSSIPELTGVDLETKIYDYRDLYPDMKFIGFKKGGFKNSENDGIEEAILNIVKEIPVKNIEKDRMTYNIIGSCADLFKFREDELEIVRMLDTAFGIKPISILSSNTTISQIEKMGAASINIVLREEGLKGAKFLESTFGTPYIHKRPYGYEGTKDWIEKISEILDIPIKREFLMEERELKFTMESLRPYFHHELSEHEDLARLNLGGNREVVKGILEFGKELGFKQGFCWCERKNASTEEIPYRPEDEWSKFIKEKGKDLITMASGEALNYGKINPMMQISNPDVAWRINPYEPPLVGYRGAMHLINLWINKLNNFI